MESAFSEADGIDYTDPEELELLVATLIDLDAMDGKWSVSLIAECSSSPDVNTRYIETSFLLKSPLITWILFSLYTATPHSFSAKITPYNSKNMLILLVNFFLFWTAIHKELNVRYILLVLGKVLSEYLIMFIWNGLFSFEFHPLDLVNFLDIN